ncbi:MAG: membrane protein insertion efficiency factor YidD [Ignavibacteriales bacterium]|nr:membrane protein insertion efficiency factor YidD [Ignavibacteriales bacterium]
MKKVLVLLFATCSILICQPEYEEWSAVDVSYEVNSISEPQLKLDRTNIFTTVMSAVRNGYQIIISDVDGDNCPFYPSCSNFFVQAIKKTNIFQAVPMFFDRFTRDSNLFKDATQYPFYKTGRLYDPVDNYTLNPKNIKFIPYYIIVKD